MKPFRLTDTFLATYQDRRPPFGFNGFGELVYMRTYSRLKDDGSNEVWWETVKRVVEGTYNMQKRHIFSQGLHWKESKAQRSAQEMYDRIFNMKFLPPGRGLWAMGSPLTEEKGLFAALNNCAFVSTEEIAIEMEEPFTFLMDASMLGIGVGFDTKGAGKILVKGFSDKEIEFRIPDTREGWVESVGLLIRNGFTGGPRVRYIYDDIRPEGAYIKGFGGVCSGYKSLGILHQQIVKTLDRDAGKPISIECIVDLQNHIGCCVVAGNVRRTAEIVFGDPNSEEYLTLKDYRWNGSSYEGSRIDRAGFGWTSNNSVLADVGMDYTRTGDQSGINGEPGYLWLENCQKFGRMVDRLGSALEKFSWWLWKDRRAKGANPCVTADTWVLTKKGPRQVEELQGKPFTALIDGHGHASTDKGFWQTGYKPIFRVLTSEGYSFKATSNHLVKTVVLTEKTRQTSWKKVEELSPGDLISIGDHRAASWDGKGCFEEGWLLGSLIGDGHFGTTRPRLEFWGSSKMKMLSYARSLMRAVLSVRSDCGSASDKTPSARARDWVGIGSIDLLRLADEFGIDKSKQIGAEIEKASSLFYAGFLRGWFDADGSVQGSQKKGVSVRLSSIHRDNLLAAQRMLLRIGIVSAIYPRREGGKQLFPDGKGGRKFYNTTPAWELIVSRQNLFEFQKKVNFTEPAKEQKLNFLLSRYVRTPNRERFVATVDSIAPCGSAAVFDCTVPGPHEFDGNGVQLHNCVEQSLESHELCCLVETFPANHENLDDYKRTLKFAYLYAKTVTLGQTHWMKTNQVMLRNRRIGCSQSGVQQFVCARGIEEYRKWCDEGYNTIQYYDEVYSEWMCIPRSVKTTSIKPSGTVSLLAGATPGMHWPEDIYYIRRMRLARNSELVAPLKKAGYLVEPCKGQEDSTVVVEVPVALDDLGGKLRPVKQVSMWEQLSMAAFIQEWWADNQVSCTVTFDPMTEGAQIKHALDYFQYRLKGVSFLPRMEKGAFAQMPYESITREQFEQMSARLRPLDLSGIGHEEVETEKFCDGGACTITRDT